MRYIFTVFFFLMTQNITAYIVESDTITSVVDYISLEGNILFIFDIDNTLAHPYAELSSDEWFCHQINKKMAEGFDYLTSIYYILPVVYYAQFNVLLTPSEAIAPFLIEQLIKHTISVMALTTRSLFVAERTIEQLEAINIRFFLPHVSQEDLVLPMQHPCFYRQSILFSGNNDKGEALIQFFKTMNYYPDKVIFIDDKLKYLLSVEKALKKYNISFIGIRYSGCDEKVKNFDPSKAEKQWRELREKSNNYIKRKRHKNETASF